MPNPPVKQGQDPLPVQPVDRPILCSPYLEPTAYWEYDQATGEARKVAGRRPAGYYYLGVPHTYEPDYLVRLRDGRTLILEIKGHEDDQDHAKHVAARRWVAAVNNWGRLGAWEFHVCKDPQQLVNELRHLLAHPTTPTVAPPLAAD